MLLYPQQIRQKIKMLVQSETKLMVPSLYKSFLRGDDTNYNENLILKFKNYKIFNLNTRCNLRISEINKIKDSSISASIIEKSLKRGRF